MDRRGNAEDLKNRNIIPYGGFNRVISQQGPAAHGKIFVAGGRDDTPPFTRRKKQGGLFMIRFADKLEVADAQTAVMLDAAQIFADAYDFDIDEIVYLLSSGNFAAAVDDAARGVYANRILQYEELGHEKAAEAADLLESYINSLRRVA